MLIWTDNYLTGIEEIDRQHQEIFRKSNAIFTAMKLGQSTAVLVPMVRIMRDYLQDHYNTEQYFMEKHEYPDRKRHTRLHEETLQYMSEWLFHNQSSSLAGATGREIQKRLSNSMLEHISVEDAKFGEFILKMTKAA